jgi:hypothetical protein
LRKEVRTPRGVVGEFSSFERSWHFWAQAAMTSSWKGKAYFGLNVRTRPGREVGGTGVGCGGGGDFRYVVSRYTTSRYLSFRTVWEICVGDALKSPQCNIRYVLFPIFFSNRNNTDPGQLRLDLPGGGDTDLRRRE